MSVMRCDRNGCESIMCYLLSYTYGYICGDCLNELIALGPGTNIREFMDQEKDPNGQEMKKMSLKRWEAMLDLEFANRL